MKTILLFLCLGMGVAVGATESFEAPADEVGGTLEGKAGWEGSGVEVNAAEAWAGSQALKLAAKESEAHCRIGRVIENGLSYVDLAIRPVAVSAEGAETALNVYGAQIGFIRGEGNHLSLVLVDGKSGKTKLIATPLLVAGSGEANEWIQLTIRREESSGKWDLYAEGRLVAINQTVDLENAAELTLYGSEGGATYLDAVSLSGENPLFKDSDGDGMPDAEEAAYGLNPYVNDREGDLDGDGVSNLEEVLAGSAPNVAGTPGKNVKGILYVDNRNGSDANGGKASYAAVGTEGPKASLKAAMSAAESGNVIVVLPGNGMYDEGSRGETGKPLTIKTVGALTIK